MFMQITQIFTQCTPQCHQYEPSQCMVGMFLSCQPVLSKLRWLLLFHWQSTSLSYLPNALSFPLSLPLWNHHLILYLMDIYNQILCNTLHFWNQMMIVDFSVWVNQRHRSKYICIMFWWFWFWKWIIDCTAQLSWKWTESNTFIQCIVLCSWYSYHLFWINY